MTLKSRRRWQLNQDYPTLKQWFKDHQWESPIPKDILPELGIIIEDICAAGLYTDKSSTLGYMYGIFSNPNIPKLTLFKSMKECFEGIKELAKELNLKYIYTTTGEMALHKLYNNHLHLTKLETAIQSYIIDLNNTNKNLDWISE